MSIDARDYLIVSLDVSTDAEAWSIVRELQGVVNLFKISHQLWSAAGGTKILRGLHDDGKKIFLDFKYHDIYESVRSAVSQIAPFVSFLTLHGNGETIRGARAGRGSHHVKLLAFTALSSFDETDLKEIYNWTGSVEEFMVAQARAAQEKGVDGVIASGPQVRAVRDALPRPFLIVTPGIRMHGTPVDDHKRALGPAEALTAGSDYLVVGRPIIAAESRVAAAQGFIEAMQPALDRREAH